MRRESRSHASVAGSLIPGAQFLSLPGEDHISVMCQPQLVRPEVVPFLEQIG
jgi:hypothetical protein